MNSSQNAIQSYAPLCSERMPPQSNLPFVNQDYPHKTGKEIYYFLPIQQNQDDV